MINFIHNHLEYVLFVLLLISQIGHAGTTHIATPKLKLTDNPIAGKFRRLLGSLLSARIPFAACLDMRVALMVLVSLLLTSASNALKKWMLRVLYKKV
jgi:hypothetical protein